MNVSMRWLKRGLIFFWALWLTIVMLTNLFDLLKARGTLPASWTLASGNYGYMQSVTSVHDTPAEYVTGLFVSVIVWQLLAAILLWRAYFAWGSANAGLLAAVTAFAVSIALWAAFMIADEIFFVFDAEATHMRIFTAQIATLLALRLMPDY